MKLGDALSMNRVLIPQSTDLRWQTSLNVWREPSGEEFHTLEKMQEKLMVFASPAVDWPEFIDFHESQ